MSIAQSGSILTCLCSILLASSGCNVNSAAHLKQLSERGARVLDAKQFARQQLEHVGATNVLIRKQSVLDRSAANNSSPQTLGLPYSALQLLTAQIPSVQQAAPVLEKAIDLHHDGQSLQPMLVGCKPAYLESHRLEMQYGRFIFEADRIGSDCVITQPLAKRLFPKTMPVGQSLRVDGVDLEIVGVTQPLTRSAEVADLCAGRPSTSLAIFVPTELFRKQFAFDIRRATGEAIMRPLALAEIDLQMMAGSDIDQATSLATKLLEATGQDDVTLISPLVQSRELENKSGEPILVDAQGSKVTTRDVASLAKMRTLQYVFLDGIALQVEDLMMLQQLPELELLSLRDTGLGENEIEQLKSHLPSCRIIR